MTQHADRSGFLTTVLAGALALLPMVLSVAAVVWVAGLLVRMLSPDSVVGSVFEKLGLTFIDSPGLAYAIGVGAVVVACYLLGLFVTSKIGLRMRSGVGRVVGRIPVFGQVYNFAAQFVGMLKRDGSTDLQSMSPVWVAMGSDGAAVLALLPSAAPVRVGDTEKVGVLVPMAPVPFGGGLIFVPRHWVVPANISIEELTSIYVSMGLSAPSITNPPADPAPPPGGTGPKPN